MEQVTLSIEKDIKGWIITKTEGNRTIFSPIKSRSGILILEFFAMLFLLGYRFINKYMFE